MTVTYIQHVHTAGKLGTFTGLLPIWKGGVFKAIWRGLLIYVMLYGTISVIYRFVLSKDETAKLNFERLCVYCESSIGFIPLSFILGFYVTQVVNRWWLQYNSLHWPDTLAMNLAVYLPGGGEAKQIRRLVVRLANLSSILVLRRISPGVARRFPTYDHFVEAGLMTLKEQKQIDLMHEVTENLQQITWLPIQWAQAALGRAKDDGMIASEFFFTLLQKDLNDLYYDKTCGLIGFAWINIPLVYTQLVTMAVHLFFFVRLFGMQYLQPTKYLVENGQYVQVEHGTPNALNLSGYDDTVQDFYIPFFTIVQFVFFFGWLKVAETLINPFGDDDDDFDLNYLVDRNFQVSYLMVEMEKDNYRMEEDTYGGRIPPAKLPHTLISMNEDKDQAHAPRLTENIIINAEEIANEDNGKPLFHIESSPRPTHSRRNSIIGIGRLDLLSRGVGVSLARIRRDTLEGDIQEYSPQEDTQES